MVPRVSPGCQLHRIQSPGHGRDTKSVDYHRHFLDISLHQKLLLALEIYEPSDILEHGLNQNNPSVCLPY